MDRAHVFCCALGLALLAPAGAAAQTPTQTPAPEPSAPVRFTSLGAPLHLRIEFHPTEFPGDPPHAVPLDIDCTTPCRGVGAPGALVIRTVGEGAAATVTNTQVPLAGAEYVLSPGVPGRVKTAETVLEFGAGIGIAAALAAIACAGLDSFGFPNADVAALIALGVAGLGGSLAIIGGVVIERSPPRLDTVAPYGDDAHASLGLVPSTRGLGVSIALRF